MFVRKSEEGCKGTHKTAMEDNPILSHPIPNILKGQRHFSN